MVKKIMKHSIQLSRTLKFCGKDMIHRANVDIYTYSCFIQDSKTSKTFSYESNYTKQSCCFQFPLQDIKKCLDIGGLRNQSNTVEVDITFFISPCYHLLEIIKCKRSDGIALSITAFSFQNRVKKCTGLLIFCR